jgi:electron transfer flavoprotein beta subunit
MNIIVLVKQAFVAELQPRIRSNGKTLEKEKLVYEMNDWDRYALEEAIKLKEQKGAQVLVISAGENCDNTLRQCFAVGADRAIMIPFDSMDSWQVAEVISEVIKKEKFDLILAGFQSQDLNNALVGPILAGMLNLPYATAITSIEFEYGGIRIKRELETGIQEEDTLPLPCLLTVQTGINKPRYAPVKSILKAKTKAIEKLSSRTASSAFEVEKLYFPVVKKANVIEGPPNETSTKLIALLKERGLL